MKKLLNTLFVTSEDVYVSLDGENVAIEREHRIIARFPLHTLTEIVCFNYAGASPAFMGACAERAIGLSFCTPRGRFLARVANQSNGNVLLRRRQYRIADDVLQSTQIARMMILGKVNNARNSIRRTCRDHGMRVNQEKLQTASKHMTELMLNIREAATQDILRGYEGVAASLYFDCFDELILNRKEIFSFRTRNRRPPMDEVNALLSFAYSLLANDCASALEAVGLDSYVGFLHTDKPGRKSLALDLMEELRPCFADRFVLTCINNRMLERSDFSYMDSGVVLLSDKGRKTFLQGWQERKRELIIHPYLEEKVHWGMVPYVQALLLVRYIRGDLEAYPPFLWK